jgi:dihydroorotate dehydrogenase electron transfer subunit
MLATILPQQSRAHWSSRTFSLPASAEQTIVAGRFVLARCEDGDATSRAWQTYLRRPLFPTNVERHDAETRVTFLLPTTDDPGYQYLAQLPAGRNVDLLGPFGNGFTYSVATHTLLLAADLAQAPLLLPLIESHLDRGTRILFLVRAKSSDDAASLVAALPIPVEVRVEPPAGFATAVGELSAWADRVSLALPSDDYAQIADAVRQRRFRLNPGFADALVQTPLPCGVGACLACLVPLSGGSFTRACVHGPIFDLTRIG